jgi:hypothetical protein
VLRRSLRRHCMSPSCVTVGDMSTLLICRRC